MSQLSVIMPYNSQRTAWQLYLLKQEVKLFRMRIAFVFCVLAYFYGRNWNSQRKPTETRGGEGVSCPASNPGPTGCEEKS